MNYANVHASSRWSQAYFSSITRALTRPCLPHRIDVEKVAPQPQRERMRCRIIERLESSFRECVWNAKYLQSPCKVERRSLQYKLLGALPVTVRRHMTANKTCSLPSILSLNTRGGSLQHTCPSSTVELGLGFAVAKRISMTLSRRCGIR